MREKYIANIWKRLSLIFELFEENQGSTPDLSMQLRSHHSSLRRSRSSTTPKIEYTIVLPKTEFQPVAPLNSSKKHKVGLHIC